MANLCGGGGAATGCATTLQPLSPDGSALLPPGAAALGQVLPRPADQRTEVSKVPDGGRGLSLAHRIYPVAPIAIRLSGEQQSTRHAG